MAITRLIPNFKLLEMTFVQIEAEVNKAKSADRRLYDWKNIAKGLGEINRHYSKQLSDPEFLDLQNKMTKVRKKFMAKNYKAKRLGLPLPYPPQVIEFWFSGEERKKLIRGY